MNPTNSILEDIRLAVGLTKDTSDFDTDLLMHINASIGVLNQNGIGTDLLVMDDIPTWNDLIDPSQSEHNNFFKMVPLFIMLNTKLLFDPPPPSSVEYHKSKIEELIWRLKTAYETFTTTTTTIASN